MNSLRTEAQRIARLARRLGATDIHILSGAWGGRFYDEYFVIMTERARRAHVRVATFPMDHALPAHVRMTNRDHVLPWLAGNEVIADLVLDADGDIAGDHDLPAAIHALRPVGYWFGLTTDSVDTLYVSQARNYRRARRAAATRQLREQAV